VAGGVRGFALPPSRRIAWLLREAKLEEAANLVNLLGIYWEDIPAVDFSLHAGVYRW
jgi:hypothetical protein